MKIKVNEVLIGLNGKPIQQTSDEKSPEVKLGDLLIEALFGSTANEQVPEEKKFHRWQVAKLVKKSLDEGSELELPVEDVAMLKKQVAKMFGPQIVGPAWELLN